MSADLFLKVATVLEEAAKVIDAAESEKLAAVKQAREGTLKLFAEQYADLTGEELPENVFDKLAASDDEVISTVQRMVEKAAANSVSSLGHSGEADGHDSNRRLSKAERLKEAHDRFGDWAING